MKVFGIILAILILTGVLPLNAQSRDSARTRNIVCAEFLGNNFFDFNNDNKSIISLNYERKFITSIGAFQTGIGFSLFRSLYYRGLIKHENAVAVIPFGTFWRLRYKRNGFWMGLYTTTALGRQAYYPEFGNHQGTLFLKKINLQFSPQLMYQFQSRSEHFVCRLMFGPKFLASIFSDEYGDQYKFYPFWGGISIGGGW